MRSTQGVKRSMNHSTRGLASTAILMVVNSVSGVGKNFTLWSKVRLSPGPYHTPRSDYQYRWPLFVLVLPYLEQRATYDGLDPRYNIYASVNNAPRTVDIPGYSCPSDSATGRRIWFRSQWAPFSLGNYAVAVSANGYNNAQGPPCTYHSTSTPKRRPAVYVKG
jgi:hypothetical protein